MRVSLSSPLPGFHKELLDIVDLFCPRVESLGPDEGPGELDVLITQQTQGTMRRCCVRLSGSLIGEFSNEQEIYGDALLMRRLHKRQVKRALFGALSQASGLRPPWGSLTGIRPTRLLLDAMQAGQPKDRAAAWLQDTFQISDEKLSLLKEIIAVQQRLPELGPQQIACYIGIPFCVSRCRYCSFISRVAGKRTDLAAYVHALTKEIKGTARLMAQHGLTARSVYVGGGTPTVLDEEMLAQVLEAAKPLCEGASEITVEAGRPDTITPGKLRLMRDAGVGRISVNPQTMHDRTLEAVGRRHTTAQTVEAYHQAREAGFASINMDLIAGLPGENIEMFEHSLARVMALRPEGVTVHTLSVKRSSDMHRYKDALPDGDAVARMVTVAREQSALAGYRPYYVYRQKHMAGNLENIGYAIPGHACLYNIDMMEDHATVLAMGAGAMSKRVYADGRRILRAPNVKDVDHYISRVDEMLKRKHDLFLGIGKGVRAPEDAEDFPEEWSKQELTN
jgi:coproporphyrinogen dehydrogenase HemZ